MKAIEAAGAVGLTIEEIQGVADQVGLSLNRATVRSYLWNQRNNGRLVALADGRHVIARHAGRQPIRSSRSLDGNDDVVSRTLRPGEAGSEADET